MDEIYSAPHSCTCGGPLIEQFEGGSENFYQVRCALCKQVALAPKHEGAKNWLATQSNLENVLNEPAIEKAKRMARNRRKRKAKRAH